ncbi:aldo/keto reductase [Marinagarivorans algicola]|uniref:aldo/keto reductase n=1 Tax=Marinagarivorans algicola TaxID=1513270 RepID=UPI003736384E
MSEMTLSPLVLGFWRLGQWGYGKQELLRLVERSVELGVSSMDHAMVYRSEAPFGEALALNPSLRDNLQIITKCGIRPCGFGVLGANAVNHYDFSQAYTVHSVEASLRDLKTDRIDLLLLHRPDFLMDIAEVAQTFEQLHATGKVLHFGVSNFTVQQLEALQSALPHALITNQVECSPLNMTAIADGTFDQAQRLGMRPMLWSCLAGGRLAEPKTSQQHSVVAALQVVAKELGASTVEAVIYAWLMALPCKPYPILGTSKVERVQAAAEAVNLQLSREQWYRIWEASNGASVP